MHKKLTGTAIQHEQNDNHTWLCCASVLDTYSAGNSPSVFCVAGAALKIGKIILTERLIKILALNKIKKIKNKLCL
jgi:hypothetical protein